MISALPERPSRRSAPYLTISTAIIAWSTVPTANWLRRPRRVGCSQAEA